MHPVAFPDPFHRTSAAQVVVVIPARYHSSRLPGKALADIAGRPMIEYVYRRAADARGVDAVVVATDDARIAAAVASFGGVARLTRPDHRTGTDRIAEVAADLRGDIVINLQGDEPLIHREMIEQVIEPLRGGQEMSTLRRAITDADDLANPNVVKVVVDLKQDALYFSRSTIPFPRDTAVWPTSGSRTVFKHVGIYGYRRDLLLRLAATPQTPLEIAESLEQLRALEHGVRIRTLETPHDSIGVDTPEDLDRVRRQLRELAATART